jgi:hypothetical protein
MSPSVLNYRGAELAAFGKRIGDCAAAVRRQLSGRAGQPSQAIEQDGGEPRGGTIR